MENLFSHAKISLKVSHENSQLLTRRSFSFFQFVDLSEEVQSSKSVALVLIRKISDSIATDTLLHARKSFQSDELWEKNVSKNFRQIIWQRICCWRRWMMMLFFCDNSSCSIVMAHMLMRVGCSGPISVEAIRQRLNLDEVHSLCLTNESFYGLVSQRVRVFIHPRRYLCCSSLGRFAQNLNFNIVVERECGDMHASAVQWSAIKSLNQWNKSNYFAMWARISLSLLFDSMQFREKLPEGEQLAASTFYEFLLLLWGDHKTRQLVSQKWRRERVGSKKKSPTFYTRDCNFIIETRKLFYLLSLHTSQKKIRKSWLFMAAWKLNGHLFIHTRKHNSIWNYPIKL